MNELMLAAFIVLSLLDILLTRQGMKRGRKELNPIAAYGFKKLGFFWTGVIKMALCAALGAMAYLIVPKVLVIFAAITSLPVIRGAALTIQDILWLRRMRKIIGVLNW